MDVLVATDGGYAKRTPIEEYPVQGRGGKGVMTAKITDGVAGWSARSSSIWTTSCTPSPATAGLSGPR